ncbi:hypothetical protein DFH11DRAFT_1723127 [Phellopilus nigrolimitatus]|nr:hypothetical protein DFH11DRAFT_1723127 [Phellopilus nigrolimitatus]
MDAQSGAQPREREECLSCRLIGSASLGAVGAYALHQSRAHQPGSRVAKRVMAGVGISFLVASYVRWNASQFRERLR